MKKLLCLPVLLFLTISYSFCQTSVSLTWYGQSTFLLKTDGGVKILMDPVNPGMAKAEVSETVDLVTISHEHGDHNYVALAKGEPIVMHGLDGTGFAKINAVIKGVRFWTVESFHDNQGGSQRGKNAIFVFEANGMRIVHLGDLGHLLNEDQVKAIGTPDVLMIPVGAGPTLDINTAIAVIKQLNPKVLIPMHFSPAETPAGRFKLGSVEDFIKGANNAFEVKYAGHSETFTVGKLPSKTTIFVMKTN
jgi:L-ascorbate metabolism protein UlaG (beta-lactamase superfamily)